MFSADKPLSVHRWPVVRLVAGSKTEVVLLSSRFFALTTHWNVGTIPCSGEGCRLCELLPMRGLFYVAVECVSRVHILELGGYSATLLEQHAKLLYGGMAPGLVFALSRKGAKQPVRSEVIRTREGISEVPLLELAARVMTLYKFPGPNPGDDIERYESRCQAVAQVRTDRAAELLLKARDRQLSK